MTIVVIGNAGIDRTFSFQHLPRPGESLTARSEHTDLGGKGANQAVAARRCGAEVTLATSLGQDAHGDAIRQRLQREGVQLIEIGPADGATDEHIILVDRQGRNMVVNGPLRADRITPDALTSMLDRLTQSEVVVLQGNLSREATGHAAREAHRRRATVVLNPSPLRYSFDDIWPHVDALIVNEIEAADLGASSDPEIAGRNLMHLGPRTVIVTLGADGAMLLQDGTILRKPAPKVNVIDTTGAGDAFCGAFVAAAAQGFAPDIQLDVALAYATASVIRPGTQSSFPTAEAARAILRDAIASASPGNSKGLQ